MRPTDQGPWMCHWDRVHGPIQQGEPTTAAVWICEYPYRTIRLERPDDCENCPLQNLMKDAHSRWPREDPETPTRVM